jgi:hypothetical protein
LNEVVVTKAGVMAEIQVVVVAGQAQPRKEMLLATLKEAMGTRRYLAMS